MILLLLLFYFYFTLPYLQHKLLSNGPYHVYRSAQLMRHATQERARLSVRHPVHVPLLRLAHVAQEHEHPPHDERQAYRLRVLDRPRDQSVRPAVPAAEYDDQIRQAAEEHMLRSDSGEERDENG